MWDHSLTYTALVYGGSFPLLLVPALWGIIPPCTGRWVVREWMAPYGSQLLPIASFDLVWLHMNSLRLPLIATYHYWFDWWILFRGGTPAVIGLLHFILHIRWTKEQLPRFGVIGQENGCLVLIVQSNNIFENFLPTSFLFVSCRPCHDCTMTNLILFLVLCSIFIILSSFWYSPMGIWLT